MGEVSAAQLKEFEEWLDKKNKRKGSKGESKSAARKPARKPIQRSKAKSDKNTTKKPKRIRKSRKSGFSQEIREAAHARAGNTCENPLCGRPVVDLGGEHHCIPRSQYHKSDRNDLWNCACICQECHQRVTTPRTDEDKRLRRYFERRAWSFKVYTADQLERELSALDQALKDNTLELIRSFQPFTQAI